MACKTYAELMKEIKPLMVGESQEAVDKAVREALEMDYVERVDAYESNRGWALDTLNSVQPRINGKAPVELVDIKEYDTEFEISFRYKKDGKTGKVYKTTVGEYGGVFTFNEGVTFNGTVRELKQLYSDKDFINEGTTGYEQLDIDVMNEPEKMKDLARELAEFGTTDDWHKNELLANLDGIVDTMREAIPNMAIHLNRHAGKTGGVMNLDPANTTMHVGISEHDTRKTPLEVYVHEMYHAITAYAIKSRDAKISESLRRLREVHEHFMSDMTLEKFMAENEGLSEEYAKEILAYFNDADVGQHEFVAYAMTNKYVMNSLSKMKVAKKAEEHTDWASKLVAHVRQLFNRVVAFVRKEPKNANAYETMAFVVNELAQVNNRAHEVKREHLLQRFMRPFVAVEDGMKGFADKQAKKLAKMDIGTTGGTKFGAAKVWTKAIARSFVDEKMKRLVEQQMSFFGMKPEGTMQTVMRDMSESDDYADAVEKLGLVAQNIDQQRDYHFTAVALSLKEAFDKELSDDEMIALTSFVLDSDLSSIYEGLDLGRITEEGYAKGEIAKLEKKLAKEVDALDLNYYKVQAQGLGYFMQTGRANETQLLNAGNIAKKLNSVRRDDEVSASVIETIDKLASWHALSYTKEADLDLVSTLVDMDEKNGIDTIVAYAQGHKDKAEKSLFGLESDKYKLVKGYSKEIFDRDVDVKVGRIVDKREMEKRGFKLVKEFEVDSRFVGSEKLGMYISTTQVVQDLHRVTFRYTDKTMKGTSLTQRRMIEATDEDAGVVLDKAKSDIAKVGRDMTRQVAKTHKGEVGFVEPKEALVAVLNNKGEVADYRFMMSKADKERYLKMDRRSINVLGRMYASTYDKEMTPKFNDVVMEAVEKDMVENYVPGKLMGKNLKEYIEIKGDTGNKEIEDLWRVLPRELKAKHKDGFAVRRDMMHSLLGFRDLTVVDAWGLNMMPTGAKHVARIAENIWKEIVKIAKVDIILRVPTVLIGNITSNFMYSVMTGHSPLEIAKLQMQGVRDLNEYIGIMKQIVQLEAKVAAKKATKVDVAKIARLKGHLKSNPAHDLIDEGFYTTIIEELGLDEFKTSNRLTELVDEKLKNYGILKDGVHWLYLSERTPVFKAMNMATQYSDFVARYAQYHLMVRKGVSKTKAAKTVRDAFINYNKPNSRAVEWANQMGLIMFTKYFTRIQKAIKAGAKDHPLKMLMAILGQEWIVGDLEDITDQSMMTKDLGNIFYSPLDTLMRIINPSAVEAVQAVARV